MFYFRHAINKLFTKDKNIRFRRQGASGDGFGNEPKVERHGPCPCPQNTEVGWKPLNAVHHQVNDAISLFHSPGDQCLSDSVGLVVKGLPGDCDTTVFFRFPLDKRGLPAVHSGIPGQDFGN
jgi:hypothetical protein